MATKQYTEEEVAKHNKEGDLWVTIDSKVYNLSKFADLHPGGANDATQAFFGLHRLEVLQRPQYARLQIGTIIGEEPVIKAPAPGEVSKVPYAEATWLVDGFKTPYYTDGHRKFQKAVRTFFMEVVQPAALQCEENGKRIPQEVVDKMAEGRTLMNGTVTPEEFDYFHEVSGALGTRGFVDGLLNGAVIGVPPILNYGSPELQKRVVPDILNGKKFLALAISEAFAGSDVGGLQTTAVRDGDFWVVTGTKKWITNGTFADFFTTVITWVQTGFTVMLIERCDNLSTKAIKTSYSPTAGTAYVTFDKVRVPVGNTLGAVGNGMNVILTNFNHERWMVICTALSAQRVVVEECLKWASQRMAVIRSKLAAMISRVEASQNWLENITHQMNNVDDLRRNGSKLAGPIGLLKQFVTKSGQEIATGAAQFARSAIFGGRSLTVSGMGKVIENFHRTSAFDAILAGAEDVMADLGVRQAMKKMPSTARL
ncbi:acyl-CoA dehydrogenase/oxidase [Mycena leptocephala]|nr:acyl-CoA dehydrogenase/oxidase [Mycena leptocephala]